MSAVLTRWRLCPQAQHDGAEPSLPVRHLQQLAGDAEQSTIRRSPHRLRGSGSGTGRCSQGRQRVDHLRGGCTGTQSGCGQGRSSQGSANSAQPRRWPVSVAAAVAAHADPLIGPRLLQRPLQQQALRVENTLLRHPGQGPISVTRRQPGLESSRQPVITAARKCGLARANTGCRRTSRTLSSCSRVRSAGVDVVLVTLDAGGGASRTSRVTNQAGALTYHRDRVDSWLTTRLRSSL